MNIDAIKTIRVHNWKMPRNKAVKLAQGYLDILQKNYPLGLDKPSSYFVLPGFEHVTRMQPIAVYSPTEGLWELSTTDYLPQQTIN